MDIATGKLNLSHILKPNSTLQSFQIPDSNKVVNKMISETNKKQEETLKLKEVNPESLKTVVQF